MSETKVSSIEATTMVDGQYAHPTRIIITHHINNYSQLDIVHSIGKEAHKSVTDMSSADIFKTMGERQTEMFTHSATEPNMSCILKTTGGDANFVNNIDCCICDSSYMFSAGSVYLQERGLEMFAAVDSFDLSIYLPDTKNVDMFLSDDITLSTCDYSVPQMMIKLIERLMEDGPKKSETAATIDTKAKETQHSINQSLKFLLFEFLQNSDETFGFKKEFKAAAIKVNNLSGDILKFLQTVLTASTGSFLNALRRVGDGFASMIVPTIDEGDGRVKYKYMSKQLLYANPEPLYVPIVNLAASSGNSGGLFPARYIAVVPAPVKNCMFTSVPHRDFVVFPESAIEGGSAIKVPGPPWLTKDISLSKVNKDGAVTAEQTLSINMVQENYTEVEKNIRTYEDSFAELLLSWAKIQYKDMSLMGASVTMTVPLIKTISPGKRYDVYNSNGDKLFSGFCQSVTASVDSHSSRQATLQLVFSHVEMSGFELPHK